MKNIIKPMSLTIALLLIFSSILTIRAFASYIQSDCDIDVNEEKVYCNATIDDDFADDTVLVILKNAISIKCDIFTINDFAEINPRSVEHLSSALDTRVKSALDNVLYSVTNGIQATIDESLNIGKFNQVLSIKLSEIGKDKVLAAIEALEKYNEILYVGPDYYWTYCGENTDSEVYLQNFSEQWAYTQIQLDDAWEYMDTINTSVTPIRIGVIDSGIYSNHQALSSCVNTNDSDTYGDDTNYGETVDSYGHGTNIAGIIKGVAQNVELISLKVSESWIVESSDVYLAVISLDDSIPIINFSLAWKNYEGELLSTNYDMVIANALNQYNGLIVCAAGNDGVDEGIGADIDNNSTFDYYPVQHDISNMIVVGASTQSDGIKADSNYGATYVDVFAPGEKIYTTTHTGGYRSDAERTSMATPFVTGLAAMLLMVNEDLTAEMIIDIIKSTVDTVNYSNNPNNGDDIDELEDACTSGGRINALEAVMMARTYETCQHTITEYESTTTKHTVKCSTCGAKIYSESHTLQYTGTSIASGHSAFCSVCNFSGIVSHDLYMYSEATEEYIVKCAVCLREIYCTEEPEYYGTSAAGHRVSCPGGCYSFFEDHTRGTCTQTTSQYYHEATCADCGYIYQDAHTWVLRLGTYFCKFCNKQSTQTPIMPQNLPPLEIGVEISEFPIEGEELIFDLPPVNDEEELTE